MSQQPYGDNFIPVIPTDSMNHSTTHPFCSDPACPCHENTAAVRQVNEWHRDGLISTTDATEIVRGHRPLVDFPTDKPKGGGR